MMKKHCVLLGILLISGCATAPKPASGPVASAPSKASEMTAKPKAKVYPDTPDFTANCSVEGQAFAIKFHSKSGKLENNDMSVNLVFGDNEIPINLTPAWYRRADTASALANACDGVPAFQIEGTQQLLLFLNLKAKQQSDTTLVLIDLHSKRVLNRLERIGQLQEGEAPQYSVIPAQNGFQVRLVRDPNVGNEDWKWILIKKASLTTKWMRSRKKTKAY